MAGIEAIHGEFRAVQGSPQARTKHIRRDVPRPAC
jgi:hypothetical protein